jgi:hypothetical protein
MPIDQRGSKLVVTCSLTGEVFRSLSAGANYG